MDVRRCVYLDHAASSPMCAEALAADRFKEVFAAARSFQDQ